MLFTYLSKAIIYVTYKKKKKNTRFWRRKKFVYFIKTLNEVTSSSPTYDISYYINSKNSRMIFYSIKQLTILVTRDTFHGRAIFNGGKHKKKCIIKLFKIDQSRVNSLRNIYSSAKKKKKKKYPSHRDNSTFAHFV